MSNQEIILWSVLGLVVLAVLTLALASHSANARIKDYVADEGLLDPLPPRPRPPMPEAALERQRQARLYSTIKNSKRIQVTRAWSCDPNHTEAVVGEALAFSVGANDVAWVTIKKDDGHVVCIPHRVPPELTRKYGMTPVEVKFI